MYQRILFVLFCLGILFFPWKQSLAQLTAETDGKAATPKTSNGKKRADLTKKAVAEDPTYLTFRTASSAGYDLQKSGDLKGSLNAYEAALKFASTDQERCDVYSSLISIYPEMAQSEKMYESMEYILTHEPYPAFSSLSLSSLLSAVRRKGLEKELVQRYHSRLETNPKDRIALVIMEKTTHLLLHDLPKRAEYLRRLIELDKQESKTPNIELMADLAFTLRLSKKEVESAELYESIAGMTKDVRSSCLAEAAESWERAGKRDKSMVAAVEASNLGPDNRAKNRLYQWHRLLADLFLKHLSKGPALKHYTAALESATIDPYREQCREQLRLVDALKD